ncbi:hypothetical protein, partial [Burkholderia pseudomultivorans]|uniref:hypothetical protein n=1 Tax=Burkholderia pseudomultivorans TaxID=1207504 RepID=UPI001E439D54
MISLEIRAKALALAAGTPSSSTLIHVAGRIIVAAADDSLWRDARRGLSGILCLRHNMLPRRVYASQTESP